MYTLKKNLILTGFMGSGKSTVARSLAKHLEHSYFLDTDSLIEHFENISIKEIFDKHGEEYFRNAEKRLFDWIKNDVKNAIISTGGGMPIFIPEIKEAGILIYLRVDFEEILERLSHEEKQKRPLLADTTKARELFEKRDKIYAKSADYIIHNKDLTHTVERIIHILESNKILSLFFSVKQEHT
ncbi:MAG: shikimate kinase [Epsilonproteobacteria bacterium]|nr:shikimate kinase [Campylobacterota bacterium]